VSRASQVLVGTASCSYWRTSQAFSFIGSWIWLGSGICVSLGRVCHLAHPILTRRQGLYVCTRDRNTRRKERVRSTESP
jgi:hypothetical protein